MLQPLILRLKQWSKSFFIFGICQYFSTPPKKNIIEWIWRILVTSSRSPINHLDQQCIYIIYIYITPQEHQQKKHGNTLRESLLPPPPGVKFGKCQARQAQLLERYGPLEVNCEAQQRKLDAQMDELQQESRFFFRKSPPWTRVWGKTWRFGGCDMLISIDTIVIYYLLDLNKWCIFFLKK